MQIHRSALRKLVLSAIVVVGPVASAHALDTAAFGDRLKAVLAGQGAEIAWTNITENGTQVVLEGVTVGMAAKPEKVNLGNITLDSITEANGGFKIGTLAFQDYSTTEEGMTFAIRGAPPSPGFRCPPPMTRPIRWASMMLYEHGRPRQPFSVKKGDKSTVFLDKLHVETVPPAADGKPLEFTGAARILRRPDGRPKTRSRRQ